MRTRTLARWGAAAALLALLAGCGSTAAGGSSGPPAATTAPATPASWTPGGTWTGPVPPNGLLGATGTWQLKPYTNSQGYTVRDSVTFGVPLHYKIPNRLFDAALSEEAPRDLPPGQYVIPFEVKIINQSGQDSPPLYPEVSTDGVQITGGAGSAGMWGEDGASVYDHTWNLHAGGWTTWYGLIGPATPAQLASTHITLHWMDLYATTAKPDLTEPLTTLLPHVADSWLAVHGGGN